MSVRVWPIISVISSGQTIRLLFKILPWNIPRRRSEPSDVAVIDAGDPVGVRHTADKDIADAW